MFLKIISTYLSDNENMAKLLTIDNCDGWLLRLLLFDIALSYGCFDILKIQIIWYLNGCQNFPPYSPFK